MSKEKKLSENEKNQLYKALRTGNREEILKLCKDKTDWTFEDINIRNKKVAEELVKLFITWNGEYEF